MVELELVRENVALVQHAAVFDDIIGQEQACKLLAFNVASHCRSTPFPTMLFTGSHGLGKTYMANRVAYALDRTLVEFDSGSIKTEKDLVENCFFGGIMQTDPTKGVTILFDEAHLLGGEITGKLLTLLSNNDEHENNMRYQDKLLKYNMKQINVIFATTDAHKIFNPLRNRCTEVYFFPYSNEELIDIVKLYVGDIRLSCNKKQLAYCCRRRARDAFKLAENILRQCKMTGKKTLTQACFKELCEKLGYYPMGLKGQEIRLLEKVGESGPIAARAVADQLGVTQVNVEEELECYPKELGLLMSTSRGRVLTPEGKKYLKRLGQ